MPSIPPPLPVQACAAEFGDDFTIILKSLAAIVARRFYRHPVFGGIFTLLLGAVIGHASQRCARLLVRLVAGRLRPRPPRSAAPKPEPKPAPPAPPKRKTNGLPQRRGWLVAAIGYEAAGCASQLQALLAKPEVADLLARAPTLRRVLSPICRMLGIGPFTAPMRVPHPAKPAKPPPPEPELFFGKVAFRSQGYTWYEVPTPPLKTA